MKKLMYRGTRVMIAPQAPRKKHSILVAILAAVLVFGILPAGLLARYVSLHKQENEMIAAGFHISSNALKETPPRHTAVCGPDGTFAIDLYNYELENTDSVSQVDINYRVTVTGGGTVRSVKRGGSVVTATSGVYVLPKGPTKTTHTVAVRPDDGVSALTVTVTTTAPYPKTLSATFDVSSGGITVTKSTVAGDITRLTIETNQYEGQIDLAWPEGVYPNAGVVETAYGWRVGYNARQAILTAQKETTYYFEFSNSTVSNATVVYTGQGYAGAKILAISPLSFIDGDNEVRTLAAYTPLSEALAESSTLSSGWYVLDRNITHAERIICSGDVKLILADGLTLTANRGVSVNEGNALTLYGQSAEASTMGRLTATGGKNEAGIGGDNGINGGTITVNGGYITATGGPGAAGIGGGTQGSGGTIVINGGHITGTGNALGKSFCGAGIGGGGSSGVTSGGTSGVITINGGQVVATGGGANGAAGIGSGGSALLATGDDVITITGGTVTANGGGSQGAGIGGGYAVGVSRIAISGGMITATGRNGGAGIGGGGRGKVSAGAAGDIVITGGNITATGGSAGFGIGGGVGTDVRVANTTGTLTLGWSAGTHDTTSVTASGYAVNTVIFSAPYVLQSDLSMPASYTNSATNNMAGETIVPQP